MLQLLIRPSTENDLRAITHIYSHHVRHGTATFEVEPPGEDEMAKRRSTILGLAMPYLVAEQDQVVVGYAYAGPYRPRPAYRFTVEDSVYIDPDQTGRGIGRALLAALIEDCERGPWRQMIAVIGDRANQASIRLHQRFGFRNAGTLFEVGFKFDRWLDTVLMQRELSDPRP